MDMERQDTECDRQFSESEYDEQLDVQNVESDKMENSENDRQPDMRDNRFGRNEV